jgi:hypothetical protein
MQLQRQEAELELVIKQIILKDFQEVLEVELELMRVDLLLL